MDLKVNLKCMKKIFLLSILFFSLFLTNVVRAEQPSIPDFPMAFWGTATVNGVPASEGAVVKAYYGEVLTGQATVQAQGVYGYTESTKQKLLVGSGVGQLVFKIIAPAVNSGVETGGTTVVSVPAFVSGETINKNLDFVVAVPVVVPPTPTPTPTPAPSYSGGGGGGGYIAPVVVVTSTVPTSTVALVPTSTISTGKVLGEKISLLDGLIAKLKFGQKSKEVKQMQTELQKVGYFSKYFKPTTYYGTLTRTAVNKYMKDKNKPVVVVPKVVVPQNLDLDGLVAKLKLGNRSEEVKQLQRALLALKFYPKTYLITGYYGPVTKTAVQKYLASKGL